MRTTLFNDLIKCDRVFTGTFRSVYAYISFYYRYNVDDRGQLPLPFPDEPEYQAQLVIRWSIYLNKQYETLKEDYNLVRLLLNSFLYPTNTIGMQISEEICASIQNRYPLEPYRTDIPDLVCE